MSLELEVLDQLLCGEMPLAVIRGLFGDGERFERALTALLHVGEVRLLLDGGEAPRWRWAEVLVAARDGAELDGVQLGITDAGVRRIG